jgi:hypothetical protein
VCQLCKHPILQTLGERGSAVLVGHSNTGLCGMNTAGDIGAIKQMWLNEGGDVAIMPLKVFKKIWLVTYNSRHHDGQFVWHTDLGNIVIKNNSKRTPYLDLQELPLKNQFGIWRYKFALQIKLIFIISYLFAIFSILFFYFTKNYFNV